MWFAYTLKVIRDWISPGQFEINKVSITYTNTGKKVPTGRDDYTFWGNESKKWDGVNDEYWVDVTSEFLDGTLSKILNSQPYFVKDVTLRIGYYYNNKLYKYISQNGYPKVWPPKPTIGFKVPIKEAKLVGDTKMRDVTNKIKKYAGPDYNFHNESINVYELFFILLDDYKYLEITNLLGQKRKFLVDENITLPLF